MQTTGDGQLVGSATSRTVFIISVMGWNDSLPSYEAIAEYWCGKPLPGSNRIPLEFIDGPLCFACGWSYRWQFRSSRAEKSLWKGLQRAHVVARSLNGSDTVENLVLLCDPCHKESPDTASPEIFWKWVTNHPQNGLIEYLDFPWSDDDFEVPDDYRGPFAKELRAIGTLTGGERAALMSLFEEGSSSMLERLHEARERLGGVTMHWGIGFSSGTLSALLQEVIRHEGGADS
jgi:HNH endonuclease